MCITKPTWKHLFFFFQSSNLHWTPVIQVHTGGPQTHSLIKTLGSAGLMGSQVNGSLSGDMASYDCTPCNENDPRLGWCNVYNFRICCSISRRLRVPNCRHTAATSERLKVKDEFLAWRNRGRVLFCNVSHNCGDLSLFITCCNRHTAANCFSAVWVLGIYGME